MTLEPDDSFDSDQNGDFGREDVTAIDMDGTGPIVLASEVLPEEICLIPGNSKPVFPGMMFPVIFSDGPIARHLQTVAKSGGTRTVGLILAKEAIETSDPDLVRRSLYTIGTAARIMNLEASSDGGVRAILQGVRRFEIIRLMLRDELIHAQVAYPKEIPAKGDKAKALALGIMNTMRELVQNNPMFSEEVKMYLSRNSWEDAGKLADFAASITTLSGEELQEILETLDVEDRLEKVLILLRRELDIHQLKERIQHQIEEKVSKQQREYFLREQLKLIKEELGLEKDDKSTEIDLFMERLESLTLPEAAQKRVDEEMRKLMLLPQESPEFNVSRNYLDWLTSLPWGVHSEDQLDVGRASEILDRDHYGLDDVKARILEFVGVSKLRGSVEGSIICLSGPPGVGKTSLGRAIAEALGRKFFRFSLGGMRDEAEIKGHRRTYIGAMPGKFIQTLRTTGTENCVIMLDEIDKIGASYQGDPASALLEVLDPEQNAAFLDHFLDVPFDLSKVLFIATANVLDTIPGPLLDRMEVIRLSGYIEEEKLAIAKRHLIPRLRPANGLMAKDIRFTDAGIAAIIRGYAREAGVRALEKAIRSCMRKVAARKAAGKLKGCVSVTAAMAEELLGRPAFPEETLLKQSQPGVVTGLAWTPLGGTVLFIEAMAIPGKPGFKLTGQLGDVMQESAAIAYSLVNANRHDLGVDAGFFTDNFIHLHVPAGAIKKDGPSAGVTMATALISMASGRKLPTRVAMTGELTLTGHVLPVGGIKEKVIAAKRAGVTDVLLPAANEADFAEIPEAVRAGIHAHYADRYERIYELLFRGGLEKRRKSRI